MTRRTLIVMCALLVGAAEASATTKVLLCFPGGPGSTADAQPIVDRFLAKVSTLAGWSGAAGAYHNHLGKCATQFAADKPSVVIVPLHLYLAKRAAWNLSPVSTLQNKETSGQYHLVAKKGATLDSLKGQKLVTGLKADPAFFSKVAFAGKVDFASHFEFSPQRSALRAIKNVAKGKAAAVLLDDVQQRSLEGLPMAKELATLISGEKLPGAIVATVGAMDGKLHGALAGVCKSDAALCKEMRITGFSTVDAKQLTNLEQRLK